MPSKYQSLINALQATDVASIPRLLESQNEESYTDANLKERLTLFAEEGLLPEIEAVLQCLHRLFKDILPFTAKVLRQLVFEYAYADAIHEALFAALCRGWVEVAKFLLLQGEINYNAQDTAGYTYLMRIKLLRAEKMDALVPLFLHATVNLNLENTSKYTAMTHRFDEAWGTASQVQARERFIAALVLHLQKQSTWSNPPAALLANYKNQTQAWDGIPRLFGLECYHISHPVLVNYLLTYQPAVLHETNRFCLLTQAVSYENEETYRLLRNFKQANADGSPCQPVTFPIYALARILNNDATLTQFPDYVLEDYFKDNAAHDLTNELARAIKYAMRRNKAQIITQLLNLHRIRDEATLLDLFHCDEDTNAECIKSLISYLSYTDAMIIHVAVDVGYKPGINEGITEMRPLVAQFFAEILVKLYLSNSSYWKKRRSGAPVTLVEIVEHVYGLHSEKSCYNLGARQYSGKKTVEALDRGYSFTAGPKEFVKGFYWHAQQELHSIKRKSQAEYDRLVAEALQNVRDRQPYALPPVDVKTIPCVYNLYARLAQHAPAGWKHHTVNISSLRPRCVRGLPTFDAYMQGMFHTNKKKYIAICSAQNLEDLKTALGKHRMGFFGKTIGRQMFDQLFHDSPQAPEAAIPAQCASI